MSLCSVSLCKVCNNIMAEGINSFAYKYCLSSLAATVAETGKSAVITFWALMKRIVRECDSFHVLKLWSIVRYDTLIEIG